MEPEIYFLKKDTDKFNLKTIALEQTKIDIKNNILFINYNNLSNCYPKEFISFIQNYEKYPDPFIKLYTINFYYKQYYNNILKKKEYYKLFYRNIFDKTDKIFIIMIYYNSIKKYCIYKKAFLKKEKSTYYNYAEAIEIFFTTNL